MAHIRIDFDGLNQQSATIGGLSASYEDLNTRMQSLTSLINDGWKGEASQAYGEMMGKYAQQAAKMKTILDKFKSYADQASADFDELDKYCANLIRGSF